jgi:hypothetical protein
MREAIALAARMVAASGRTPAATPSRSRSYRSRTPSP